MGPFYACGCIIKALYFAFAATLFPFYAYVVAIRACGGGFYAQYFAFAAKQFPFYANGGAVRTAGAALKPCILLLQPHFFSILWLWGRD